VCELVCVHVLCKHYRADDTPVHYGYLLEIHFHYFM